MKPLIGYLGGKSRLKKKIIQKFPTDFTCYVEAFGGGAHVLLEKEPTKVEVYNDVFGDLVNLFAVWKYVPEEFLLKLQWDLVSRWIFDNYKIEMEENVNAETGEALTKVDRAVRFYYLTKTSFGSLRCTFGTSTTGKPRLNPDGIKNTMAALHDRLKNVVIENRTYEDILEIYDRPHTFFYLDPPYHCEGAKKYVKYFTDDDFIKFRERLDGIQGRFLVSLNDDEFVREVFKGYKIEELETSYSVGTALASRQNKVTELLISNY